MAIITASSNAASQRRSAVFLAFAMNLRPIPYSAT
jgi:hypothetical protein